MSGVLMTVVVGTGVRFCGSNKNVGALVMMGGGVKSWGAGGMGGSC